MKSDIFKLNLKLRSLKRGNFGGIEKMRLNQDSIKGTKEQKIETAEDVQTVPQIEKAYRIRLCCCDRQIMDKIYEGNSSFHVK